MRQRIAFSCTRFGAWTEFWPSQLDLGATRLAPAVAVIPVIAPAPTTTSVSVRAHPSARIVTSFPHVPRSPRPPFMGRPLPPSGVAHTSLTKLLSRAPVTAELEHPDGGIVMAAEAAAAQADPGVVERPAQHRLAVRW